MLKIKLLDDLTIEQEDNVLKEINYSREQLKLDLQLIKDWVKEQHHLPSSRLKEDDKFLELFLTGCKGSLESVKRKLDNYYTIRNVSELFKQRDPLDPGNLEASDICIASTLPHTAPTGERLYIVAFTDENLERFNFLSYSRVLANRVEIYLRQAGYASRCYIVADCKGASPSFLLKLSPTLLKDLVFLLEEVMPIRIIKIGFVNVPSYIETFINTLIKPLLSDKLKERFHIASDGIGDLHQYFSPKILPRDYGGESTNPSLKQYSEKWSQFENDNRSWYINELSEEVDESKRIQTDNCIRNDAYFGVYGSLKKLVID